MGEVDDIHRPSLSIPPSRIALGDICPDHAVPPQQKGRVSLHGVRLAHYLAAHREHCVKGAALAAFETWLTRVLPRIRKARSRAWAI
jgi:hypothetical protein